ncbi:response regulator transcription factor [Paractinoplanes atraurantiacus]|uniref:DNA-binding response regulator, NarL/FixJ family, contains REC and HTH domains n=1 Tax=Paractinoplanes atraurantiacus TaxID=1036182 RepID=A0A285K6S8_9ACTN|nr:response regulator transcription factor [Actinoplanes atraurantiacus]SNY67707.1 DNA-binding response regulator, NarL/FixJ family, contains REC and HTH domains [Actinoplanes atraurantiacus]
MTLRVVVADDQQLVREGLTALLDLIAEVTVVGAAADGAQALALVAEHEPDVVLMDLRMPVLDGITATARIRDRHPAVAVVVLTTYADDDSIAGALAAGARGYLTKDAGRAEIGMALRAAATGHSLLDPVVAARIAQTFSGTPVAPPPQLPDGLTPREAEVLGRIALGRTNAEIAAELFIAEATVKTHINNAFAKIGARNRAEAATYAARRRLP